MDVAAAPVTVQRRHQVTDIVSAPAAEGGEPRSTTSFLKQE